MSLHHNAMGELFFVIHIVHMSCLWRLGSTER